VVCLRLLRARANAPAGRREAEINRPVATALFIRAAHVTEIEGQIILFAKHLSSSLHKTALNLVIDPSIGLTSLNGSELPSELFWAICR
jgi:hypothetical protein